MHGEQVTSLDSDVPGQLPVRNQPEAHDDVHGRHFTMSCVCWIVCMHVSMMCMEGTSLCPVYVGLYVCMYLCMYDVQGRHCTMSCVCLIVCMHVSMYV